MGREGLAVQQVREEQSAQDSSNGDRLRLVRAAVVQARLGGTGAEGSVQGSGEVGGGAVAK